MVLAMLQFALYSHIAIQCALRNTKLSNASPVTPTSDKLHVGGFAWQLKDLYRLLTQKDVPDDNSSLYSHEHINYKTCKACTNSIPTLTSQDIFRLPLQVNGVLKKSH